jgi:hypothetical protein
MKGIQMFNTILVPHIPEELDRLIRAVFNIGGAK